MPFTLVGALNTLIDSLSLLLYFACFSPLCPRVSSQLQFTVELSPHATLFLSSVSPESVSLVYS